MELVSFSLNLFSHRLGSDTLPMLQHESMASAQLPSPLLWGSSAAFSARRSTENTSDRTSPPADEGSLPQLSAHNSNSQPAPLCEEHLATPRDNATPFSAPESTALVPTSASLNGASAQYSPGRQMVFQPRNVSPEIQLAESSLWQPTSTADGLKSSMRASRDKICRQHEFAVEVVGGSAQSCFKYTKIVHIKDKYIIENRTGEVLEVRSPLLAWFQSMLPF
jgi:hypothetical protein